LEKLRINQILDSIGLREEMEENNSEDAFKKQHFHIYTSLEYQQSERKGRDEVHRMSEVTLFHKPSGLRIEYLTTENYYGDRLRYKLKSIYIINKINKKVTVADVDFAGKLFYTADGIIPFSKVNYEFF